MKTYWVATLNAGKSFAEFCSEKNWSILLFIVLIAFFSCTNDDVVPFYNIDDDVEEAYIIYTDIEPDLIVQKINPHFTLDLNNDSNFDYTINGEMNSGNQLDWIIESNPQGLNKILSVTPWYANPLPLKKGKLIFNINYSQGEIFEHWGMFTVGNCFGGYPGCPYDWQNVGERYLGLRFEIDGKQHFAWVRMQILENGNWMVMDYAYNAEPDKAIYAGQK